MRISFRSSGTLKVKLSTPAKCHYHEFLPIYCLVTNAMSLILYMVQKLPNYKARIQDAWRQTVANMACDVCML